LRSAWRCFLGRPFRGLDPNLYQPAFETRVKDPYLRDAALRSLKNAGHDQGGYYDFSFSDVNIEHRGPAAGDLGVLVLMEEETGLLEDFDSWAGRFLRLFHDRAAAVALLTVSKTSALPKLETSILPLLRENDVWVPLWLDFPGDPIGLRSQMALKMLLNAHSTAVMASHGRVVGNTMTNVSPSNLKLIGRATYLILSHVNDILKDAEWITKHGTTPPITFAEANAVLIDAIDFVKAQEMGQTAEVALSIIRIVEALERRLPVTWEETRGIMEKEGLAPFLARRNPSLQHRSQ
jgi:hypothetical protein